MALSAQERRESMQRESRSLARITVLSRLFGRGSATLTKLQVGMQVPALAKDIALMSGMDIASAAAVVKSSLKAGISQQQFEDAELCVNPKSTLRTHNSEHTHAYTHTHTHAYTHTHAIGGGENETALLLYVLEYAKARKRYQNSWHGVRFISSTGFIA